MSEKYGTLMCKEHKIICCTKCLYQNTGRHPSTDARVDMSAYDFINQSINFRLKELEYV